MNDQTALGDHLQHLMNTVELLDAINEASKPDLCEEHYEMNRRRISELRQIALDLKADIIRLIPLCYN